MITWDHENKSYCTKRWIFTLDTSQARLYELGLCTLVFEKLGFYAYQT